MDTFATSVLHEGSGEGSLAAKTTCFSTLVVVVVVFGGGVPQLTL